MLSSRFTMCMKLGIYILRWMVISLLGTCANHNVSSVIYEKTECELMARERVFL